MLRHYLIPAKEFNIYKSAWKSHRNSVLQISTVHKKENKIIYFVLKQEICPKINKNFGWFCNISIHLSKNTTFQQKHLYTESIEHL